MTTYIGIDGGGTTTRLLVQHGEGGHAASPEYFAYPVSLKVRDGDFAGSARGLQNLLSGILSEHSRLSDDLSLAIGLSGMSRAEDQAAFKAAIRSLPEFASARLHIEGDATLTLSAVITEGEDGILLICGTGSVVYYRTRDGAVHRVGGWGPLLSDEGSGYRIGLRALRRYIGVLDGVYPRAELSKAIAERLLPEEREDRVAIARRVASDPAFVASIARDVFDVAPVLEGARELIHEEFVDLFVMIYSVLSSNALGGERPYTLYLSGSIAKHEITQEAIRMSFEASDVRLVLVDDFASCAEALEIAKTLK